MYRIWCVRDHQGHFVARTAVMIRTHWRTEHQYPALHGHDHGEPRTTLLCSNESKAGTIIAMR